MITTAVLKALPQQLREEAVMQRDLLSEDQSEDAVEVPLLLEQAADVAEECLRLRRWQADAAYVIIALRRHLTGQEPLVDDEDLKWTYRANCLTDSKVLRSGAEWKSAEGHYIGEADRA